MSKIQVTVEMEFSSLDEQAARELASQLLENRGLRVVSARVVAAPNGVKSFKPKANKPGALVVRGGRTYVVWAEGPKAGDLWGQPATARPGDAPIYLLYKDGYAARYHNDGRVCPQDCERHAAKAAS